MKEALEGKRYVEQYVQNLTHEIKSPLSAIRGAADEGLAVKGDGFLLHQAVANLLQNAVDFSPEGGVVRIEARSADARAIIAVTDEGPGAPPLLRTKFSTNSSPCSDPTPAKRAPG
jgi:two-component system, OmpR family, sensor histidine kinase CreC